MTRTPRLELRPLTVADAPVVRAQWSDPQVRRYLFDGQVPSLQLVERLLHVSAQDFAAHGWGLWGVSLPGQPTPIGTAGLRRVPGHAHVEVMVSLLPRWWGQGLAREAGVAAMRVGFGTGLERVLAMHDPGNSASQALIGRVGFQEWGALDVDLGALFEGLPERRSVNLGASTVSLPYLAVTAADLDHLVDWQWLSWAELDTRALYALLQLRAEVFVVEQDCVYQDLDDRDAHAWHLLGWQDGRLVACARVLPPGQAYDCAALGRVITGARIRGKGLGRPMMRRVMRCAWDQLGHGDLKLSGQAHLAPFYSSLGFQVCGDGYLEDGIPHVPMRWRADNTS